MPRAEPILAAFLTLAACAAPQPAPGAASAAASSPAIATAPPIAQSAASAASAAPAIAQSAAPPRERRAYRVAAIGDSLLDRRAPGRKFLDYLADGCPESRFDNFGKGGNMVNQMRRRFAAEVLGGPGKPYTHIIVFGGVNDLYSDETAGRTPRLIEQDLTQMYEAARAHGARVVAVTVAPWGGFSYYNASRAAATRELNGWIRERKQAGAVDHVIDSWPLLSCGDPDKLCPELMPPYKDGLHFNTLAHAKLAEVMRSSVFSDCR